MRQRASLYSKSFTASKFPIIKEYNVEKKANITAYLLNDMKRRKGVLRSLICLNAELSPWIITVNIVSKKPNEQVPITGNCFISSLLLSKFMISNFLSSTVVMMLITKTRK